MVAAFLDETFFDLVEVPRVRLITFLIERISKASAHLVPIKIDEPDEPDEETPPVPDSISEYVDCFESCPGCGNTFVNANIFLEHVKACVCITFEEAKIEHSMRQQRALLHRTAMRFKDAMRDLKGKSIERGQGGNREALPQNLPQDLPPQNLHPQNLHPQNLPLQDNGPGLIYPATRDSTALDQAVGLTDQAQQQQDWIQPAFLHPHAFNATPGPAPGPAPINTMPPPPLPPPRSAETPQFTMMPLLTEADFIMDEEPSESSQHNLN
ncbi:uncharacterized protein TrAFT101_010657 [Trichoderma asperellum]|uniref:uncharacterized protein n=1 Tax=Trichoderma asperellum TaxID=101201 RepID=UPI00332F10DF|nr:hypothetical protein TrAFT101_010657 [Trichoderma asperellum]